VIDDAESNEQEVEHGTLSSDSSVDLSQDVDLDFSILGNDLLALDFSRSLLGDFERFNQLFVLKDSGWVSVRQVLEKVGLKFGELDHISVLLVHKFFL
jgi:hypothetical protein